LTPSRRAGYKARFRGQEEAPAILRTTVAIPCYNEATTIAKVVSDFRKELPEAEILVVDNASSDDSAARAAQAGARVVREKRRGKGYVMQTILETVDADVCVVVDGDDTYFAEDVHQLLLPVASDQADMVVGDRLKEASSVALNDLHRFGNRAILAIINMAFRTDFQDVLSGYRVMNRNFMTTVPLITGGFETETELTLQALEKGMLIREMPIRYRARPEGSVSKLSPFADGYRILITMAVLLRNHRPLYFFSSIAVGLLAADAVYAAALLAHRLPPYGTLVHAGVMGGVALVASGLVLIGVLLNAVSAGFREMTALLRRPR
jgi:glycosyltransferase involved in cell wall biosynthesis